MLEGFTDDLLYSLRALVRRPALSLSAAGILAVGVWAATTVLAIVNAVLLASLPYPDADRLIVLSLRNLERGSENLSVSMPIVRDWIDQSRSLDRIGAALSPLHMIHTTAEGAPERLTASIVSPVLLRLLGAEPLAGRIFGPDDDVRPGEHRVVVLGYEFWQRSLEGDPGAVGKAVTLNGAPYVVIGVLPPNFTDYPNAHQRTDVWLPVMMASEVYGADLLNVRTSNVYAVIGRLADGVTLEGARTEMATISERLASAYPDTDAGWTVDLDALPEVLLRDFRVPLLSLVIGSGMLLFIGCANAANLLLLDSIRRRGELALRLAIGSSRFRLARLALVQTVCLTVVSALAGLGATLAFLDPIVATIPIQWPRFVEFRVDAAVALLTIGLTLAVAVTTSALGVSPSLGSSPASALRGTGKGKDGGSRSAGRLRRALVVAEITVATTMLIGAVLIVQSLERLRDADLGFDPEGLIAMQLELPSEGYAPSDTRALARRLVEELPSVPAAEGVYIWSPMVPGQSSWFTAVRPQDQPTLRDNELPLVRFHYVGPGAVEGVGLRLVAGRGISEIDDERGAGAIVLSESAADALWPGQEPIGKVVRRWNRDQWLTVVGIVEDARQGGRLGPNSDFAADVYFSFLQDPLNQIVIMTRSASDVDAVLRATEAAVRRIAAEIPVFDVASMESRLAQQEGIRRLTAYLSAAYGAVALALAMTGLFSVLSFAVKMRRSEIGLRMALGAQPGTVLRQIVSEGLVLALPGVGAGLAVALVMTHRLASLLYETSPTDAPSFAMVATLLVAACVAACAISARSVLKLDPSIALHEG